MRVRLRRRRSVWLVLGLDLPGAEGDGGDWRVGRSHVFVVSDRRGFGGGLGDVLGRLTWSGDQSLEPAPLRVCGLSRVHDRGDQGAGTEVDGHDEANDEGRHQQRPRPHFARKPYHGAVDGSARPAARLSGQSEQAYQCDHGDSPRQHIEKPWPGRLRPEHVRAQRDGTDDGHEPRCAEARCEPLLQAGQDRAGMGGDRECAQQPDENEQGAGYLPNLARCQVRPARPLRTRGT